MRAWPCVVLKARGERRAVHGAPGGTGQTSSSYQSLDPQSYLSQNKFLGIGPT